MIENKEIEQNILEIRSLIEKINLLLNKRKDLCLEIISDTVFNLVLLNKEHNFNKIYFSEICKRVNKDPLAEEFTDYEKKLIIEKNKYNMCVKLRIFNPENVPTPFSAPVVSVTKTKEHEGGDLIYGLKSNSLSKQIKNNIEKLFKLMEFTPSATRQNSDYLSFLTEQDILSSYFEESNCKTTLKAILEIEAKEIGLKKINRIAYDLFRHSEIIFYKDESAMITLEYDSEIKIFFNKKEEFEIVCRDFIGPIDLDNFVLSQKHHQEQLEQKISLMSEFNDFFIFGA